MFAEQAVYTSLKTRHQEGYQLAAHSPGITADLSKELEAWGPAHDSLLPGEATTTSVNFHPLASGDYCISQTVAAGEEYSGRVGPRVYTQMLVVPAELFGRFANNPFAVLEAATASGQMPVYDHPPAQLEPVRLLGRASAVNQLRLAELAVDPGIDALVLLLSMAVESPALAIRSRAPLTRLVAGFFCLLPLAARLRFSFTTGLRYSARRVFRLMVLPEDTAEQRSLQRASGAALLDFTRSQLPSVDQLPSGWARLVRDLFRAGQGRLLPELLRLAQRGDDGAMSLDDIAHCVEADLLAKA